MKKENPITDNRTPGEMIREELAARGWTQGDLARIINRPLPTINRIIQGKHAILPEMARALGDAFGTDAKVWAEREALFRLSMTDPADSEVRRRARLFSIGPIAELQKRGWITPSDDVDAIEKGVLDLYGIGSLDDKPVITAAMRKSDALAPLSPAQTAWVAGVRKFAKCVPVSKFDTSKLESCAKKLRQLAAYPTEVRHVAKVLGDYGIRFLVVEPLAGSKVDGTTTWLSEAEPVIALSIRHDRLDNFWFTLCHEFAHVRNGDAASVDSDITGEESLPLEVKPAFERKADEDSSNLLVPKDEMESFIKRIGPLYSKDNIVQFAHRVKMHPGVIIGQLHHRHELSYRTNYGMLPKVRQAVIPTCLTEGWGHTVDLRS